MGAGMLAGFCYKEYPLGDKHELQVFPSFPINGKHGDFVPVFVIGMDAWNDEARVVAEFFQSDGMAESESILELALTHVCGVEYSPAEAFLRIAEPEMRNGPGG